MNESGSRSPSFFSAPLEAAEVERLRVLVERRVALRRDVVSEVVPRVVAPGEFGRGAPSTTVLEGYRALFDERRGGMMARAARRVANVVLGVFGRPQGYVNAAVRAAIESTARALGMMDDEARRMGACVAAVDERIAELERQVVMMEHRRAGRTDGARVFVGQGPEGWIRVGERPGAGVDVVADSRRLPFATGSVGEITVGQAVPADLALEWLTLLRAGGCLRITGAADAPALIDAMVAARAELDGAGRITIRTSEDVVEIVVHWTA
jgi:hypothetical protein